MWCAFSSMVKTKLIESNWTRVRTTASRAQKNHNLWKRQFATSLYAIGGAYKNHCGAEEARLAHNQKDGWSKQPNDMLGRWTQWSLWRICAKEKSKDEGAHIKPSHCCVMGAYRPRQAGGGGSKPPNDKFFFCNLQNELQKDRWLNAPLISWYQGMSGLYVRIIRQ